MSLITNKKYLFTLFLGEEAEIKDYIPVSPPLTYNSDAGKLVVVPDDRPTSPRRRKSRDSKLGTSPLAKEWPHPLTVEQEKSKGDHGEEGPTEGEQGLVDNITEPIKPNFGKIYFIVSSETLLMIWLQGWLNVYIRLKLCLCMPC